MVALAPAPSCGRPLYISKPKNLPTLIIRQLQTAFLHIQAKKMAGTIFYLMSATLGYSHTEANILRVVRLGGSSFTLYVSLQKALYHYRSVGNIAVLLFEADAKLKKNPLPNQNFSKKYCHFSKCSISFLVNIAKFLHALEIAT